MIKICVFSDSHGSAANMIAAVEREKPALCFFLGDGERDLHALQARFQNLPIYAVRGNCDLRSKRSASLVCTVGGVTIFAAHGHQHEVKHEFETLAEAAREAGAALALFGHTHLPTLEQVQGVTLLNPGAIGSSVRAGYALLSVENGQFSAELKTV